MADKIYGICGTNKCKREVIPKETYKRSGEVLHAYSNVAMDIQAGHTKVIPAFTDMKSSPLQSLSTPAEYSGDKYARKFNADGLYAFQVRMSVTVTDNKYVRFGPFLDDTRLAGYEQMCTNAGETTQDMIFNYLIPIKKGQVLEFRATTPDNVFASLKILDIYIYALDWDGKV